MRGRGKREEGRESAACNEQRATDKAKKMLRSSAAGGRERKGRAAAGAGGSGKGAAPLPQKGGEEEGYCPSASGRGAGGGASISSAYSGVSALATETDLPRLVPLPAPGSPKTPAPLPLCPSAAGEKGEGGRGKGGILHSDLAVCVWIPRFALRCEEQRRADKAHLPTALLAPNDLRRVWQVGSAARKAGVKPGMTISQAIGLCSSLVVWEPDPVYYDEQFSRLLLALKDVSPVIEPVELGRVFIGVDGLEGLYGSAEKQLEAIRAALGEAGSEGISASANRVAGKKERGAGSGGISAGASRVAGNKERGAGSGTSIGSLGSDVGAPTSEFTLPGLAPLPAPGSPSLPAQPASASSPPLPAPGSPPTIGIGEEKKPNSPPAPLQLGGGEEERGCPSATVRRGEEWERLAHLGWAKGKFPAWVAATKAKPGSGFIVTSQKRKDFLASQPVAVLPMSPHTHKRLVQLGIKRVGQLTKLPEIAVVSQFGHEGRKLWELATGEIVDPVVGRETPEPILTEIDFPNPVADLGVLGNALERLVERALHHPRRQCWRVLEVSARAKQEHGASWAIRITLKDPTANKQRICAPLKTRLEQTPPTGAVETLSVELVSFVRGTDELQLFARDANSSARAGRRRALRAAVNEMKTRFKHSTMYHVVEVQPQSRIPERRYALVNYDP